jgi:hypothetical protein
VGKPLFINRFADVGVFASGPDPQADREAKGVPASPATLVFGPSFSGTLSDPHWHSRTQPFRAIKHLRECRTVNVRHGKRTMVRRGRNLPAATRRM